MPEMYIVKTPSATVIVRSYTITRCLDFNKRLVAFSMIAAAYFLDTCNYPEFYAL